MSSIENTIIARIEKNGERFEILVDPKLAYDYKTGVRKDLTNVLISEEVYKDANKGERQGPQSLKKAFGTENIQEIAGIIFRDGDLQLTTDQRRKILDEKKKQIVSAIAKNAIDPRTKTPHPIQRIENALEQARFSFDAFKSVDEQMLDAIESIREIIPISLERIRVQVTIPAQFVGRLYGVLKEYGFEKESYNNDGSMQCVCAIPAGIEGEFYDRLNKLTAGQVSTKRL
ncbi:ribosome assembly factor SBDS [Candidatus Micrarchaeota archaeon]|nr:ribosome assembly factor SBDS [Candidatus Micrarchaeota archaeon]